ncbi:MAG: hypothetical protein U0414_19695 [Polyangiaceae bacterium]
MSPPIVANGNGNQNISAELIEIVDSTTNQVVSGKTLKVVAGRLLRFTVRTRSPAASLEDTLKWTIEGQHTGNRLFLENGKVGSDPPQLKNEEVFFYFTGGRKGAIKIQANVRVPATATDPGGARAAEASVQFEVDSPRFDRLAAEFTPLVQGKDGRVTTKVALDFHFTPPGSSSQTWEECLWHEMHAEHTIDGKPAAMPQVRSLSFWPIHKSRLVPITALSGANDSGVKMIPMEGKDFRLKSTHTFHYFVREGAALTETTAGPTIGLSIGRVICTFIAAFDRTTSLGFSWKINTSYCEPDGEAAGFASSDCPYF